MERNIESSKVRAKENKMGLYGAISYIIGNIVGSGLFIAPRSILISSKTVGMALVIWAVSAIISVLGSFCYVELGTSIRQSGCDFAYLCYARWYSLAFAFMIVGCVLVYPATVAIQAETFAEYVMYGFNISLCSSTASYFAKKLISFSLIWILLFLNFFSLEKLVSKFQIAASIAKVVSTAIVIGTGFYFLVFKGETQYLAHPFANGDYDAGSLCAALFAGLFTYDGWDILNYGMEEIKNPKKTMPLAIVIGMTLVAVIFLATNISYFTVLDIRQIEESDAIASTFAKERLGDFQYIVPFLICILLIGSINSSIFSASRYLYAAARVGHLPSFISCTNYVNDSPRAAVFVNAILSMALAFAGDLKSLMEYVGFAMWLQRAVTLIVLLWIRFGRKPVHPEAVRTPIFIPIIFFIICAALTITTIAQNIAISSIGLVVLAIGYIAYFLFIYERWLIYFPNLLRLRHSVNHYSTVFVQIVFDTVPELAAPDDINTSINCKSSLSDGSSVSVASASSAVQKLNKKSKWFPFRRRVTGKGEKISS
ncbi:hypothetical protein AB6A40_003178 [Gnathostoma spinigerum]|uniref:Uncharacterized protein n=1 Tax=Gnathostoma spinigerum TaxID=75299 RepID=A0ABD6E8T2_9BILA